jgi:octanoyl-[GcvH]:protein N-octanoyltransferase
VPGLDVQAIEDAVISTYQGYASLRSADFSSYAGITTPEA